MAAVGQRVGRPPGLDPVKGGKEVGCPVSIRSMAARRGPHGLDPARGGADRR